MSGKNSGHLGFDGTGCGLQSCWAWVGRGGAERWHFLVFVAQGVGFVFGGFKEFGLGCSPLSLIGSFTRGVRESY